jgi:16S rRNA (cytidine1402-2'-O)-methyltransferase
MPEEISPSTLYIVSTRSVIWKILTVRALNILKAVDVIACEDTRHSLKLLNFYQKKKRLISYHSYNEKASANGILKLLEMVKQLLLLQIVVLPVSLTLGIFL